MSKKVLVLNGNPKDESFCKSLAQAYFEGSESAGHSASLIHINDLTFDPNLHMGRDAEQDLEPDLVSIQEHILNADHLVFVYPIWWGVVPAMMKALIDRVFLPGYAFKFEEGDKFPVALLKGRTARLIVTMDTPPWFYKLRYGAPGHKMMKGPVLGFSGVKPVKITEVGPMYSSTDVKRKSWLEMASKLGKEGL